MLPYLLAAVGGYLIGNSLKSEQYADGGRIKYPKYHGSPYDRGHADSYYGRPKDPHYYPEGTYEGEKVTILTEEELAAYNAGYDENTARKEFAKGGETKAAKDFWDLGKPIKKVKWLSFASFENKLGYSSEEIVELTYKKWSELTKEVKKALVSVMPKNFEHGGMMADDGDLKKYVSRYTNNVDKEMQAYNLMGYKGFSDEVKKGLSQDMDFITYTQIKHDEAQLRREQGFENGGKTEDKYSQASKYWSELKSQMTPKQLKYFEKKYKEREAYLMDNFNDSEIAEYINGEIKEQFDKDLKITKYNITGKNWFKLGFKYIVYRECLEEPEFHEM